MLLLTIRSDNVKNDVAVNEEKELSKNNKSNYSNKNYKVIIAMLMLIIVLLTLVILFLVVNSNNNEDNDKNNNNNEVNDVVNNENEKVDEEDNNNNITDDDKVENNLKEIEISDKELKALENLPVITTNSNNIPRYSVYQSKKIMAKDVDINILIVNAMEKMNYNRNCVREDIMANNLCDYTYNVDLLKNKIKELYGDFNYELPNKVEGSYLLGCTLVNDHYACCNSGGDIYNPIYWRYFGGNITYVDDINLIQNVKAEMDEKYLYIYQNFAKIAFSLEGDEEDLNNYKFKAQKYSDTDELILNKVFVGKDYYEEGSNVTPFLTKIAKELEGKLTTFKHTFMIDDNGNYVWISTEPINS